MTRDTNANRSSIRNSGEAPVKRVLRGRPVRKYFYLHTR